MYIPAAFSDRLSTSNYPARINATMINKTITLNNRRHTRIHQYVITNSMIFRVNLFICHAEARRSYH